MGTSRYPIIKGHVLAYGEPGPVEHHPARVQADFEEMLLRGDPDDYCVDCPGPPVRLETNEYGDRFIHTEYQLRHRLPGWVTLLTEDKMPRWSGYCWKDD